jgi:hypothetical protein
VDEGFGGGADVGFGAAAVQGGGQCLGSFEQDRELPGQGLGVGDAGLAGGVGQVPGEVLLVPDHGLADCGEGAGDLDGDVAEGSAAQRRVVVGEDAQQSLVGAGQGAPGPPRRAGVLKYTDRSISRPPR